MSEEKSTSSIKPSKPDPQPISNPTQILVMDSSRWRRFVSWFDAIRLPKINEKNLNSNQKDRESSEIIIETDINNNVVRRFSTENIIMELSTRCAIGVSAESYVFLNYSKILYYRSSSVQ